jgi:hypothetical protein
MLSERYVEAIITIVTRKRTNLPTNSLVSHNSKGSLPSPSLNPELEKSHLQCHHLLHSAAFNKQGSIAAEL